METPEQTKARNLYEVEAKIKATANFETGVSFWPNGYVAFSYYQDKIMCYNAHVVSYLIAKFRLKSWKH